MIYASFKAANDPHWLLCFCKRPAEELFDLKNDPDCVINLAGAAAQQTRRAALETRMLAELKQMKTTTIKYFVMSALLAGLVPNRASAQDGVRAISTGERQAANPTPNWVSAPWKWDATWDGIHPESPADITLTKLASDGSYWMFYTQRRQGVSSPNNIQWMYGCAIGIAKSTDKGKTWVYQGTAQGLDSSVPPIDQPPFPRPPVRPNGSFRGLPQKANS